MTPDETDAGPRPVYPIARRADPSRRRGPRAMTRLVRGLLLLMAAGFAAVLGAALTINPYAADGSALTGATHTQLGLPPCNMVTLIGKPCPACGMTTSFSLLMHGDVANSARANWVGTLLASACLFAVPWALVSAARRRYLWIRSLEMTTTVAVGVLLALMFARWGAVLLQG